MICLVRWLARICEVGFILAAVAALGLWCSIPDPSPLATRNPATTAFIELRRSEGAAIDWRWKPLGSISRYLRAAVVYAEDDLFYQHDGVDWRAMKQALDERFDKGVFGRGGSTITQQLAKNLYLSPDRSMVRKARELLITYALEDALSKQRILELYLNICEWGPGVFGAEAAARHWFGHSAQRLTPAEAVRLATALPNPAVRMPTKNSSLLRTKRVRLLRRLRSQGLIGADQERAALEDLGAGDAYVRPDKPSERD
jgi:monofunctional biosynthetic peptidoglycan transglycosylase